jgi:arginase
MARRKTAPKVTMIGVPANSSGYIDGVGRGPSALCRAGLVEELSNYFDVHDYGDVLFSQPVPEKSSGSSIIAERSLVSIRDTHSRIGMLFVDGHEDAYTPQQSPTGEAADMEFGLACTWSRDCRLVSRN